MTATAPPPVVADRAGAHRLELVWLLPVSAAVVVAVLTAQRPVLTVPLLAVALVPWALQALRRPLPTWAFGVLAMAPVALLLVVEGLGASVFLGTAALSLLASRAARGLPLAGVVVLALALPFTAALGPAPFDPGCFYFAIGDLLGVAVGILLGHALRLAEDLRAADARLAAVRAQQERARLARDVHDLVAHSLTVAVLHVGGARRILRSDPGAAEAALEQAEHVCRDSLDGIRRVVGLLRADDDLPTAVGDLPGLVQTYRAAGVEVDLRLDGRVDDLPLYRRSLLHRVAQEALANAARYRTPGSPVAVECVVGLDAVTLLVDNAAGATVRTGAGGYGLLGLQEQVAEAGGGLVSRAEGGRWRVECRLPVAAQTGPVPAR